MDQEMRGLLRVDIALQLGDTSDARGPGTGRSDLFMKTCYAIIETCPFYGGETTISLVVDDTGSQYFSFSNRDEARAWIRKLVDHNRYHRRSYITGRTYAVTEVGSEDFDYAFKCTWGASPGRCLLGI
jgi:hypothetical protein